MSYRVLHWKFRAHRTKVLGEVYAIADPAVQQLRMWLSSQPFSLRLVTLILFMVEAIESKYGKETATKFENDLREAFKKLPFEPFHA